MINKLPHAIHATHAGGVEPTLVGHARDFEPTIIAGLGRHIRDHLDPDGTLADEQDRARRRGVAFHQRRDGSARGTLELTARRAAKWQTLFDSLARPCPAADGTDDPRTAEQRRHDAMEDIADRLLRGGDLPDSGGTPATVIVTMTLDQLQTRIGLAGTAHGGTITLAEALELACEADIIPIVLNDAGGVLCHGRPPPIRETRLDLRHGQRDPLVDPTTLDRLRPDTPPQQHPSPRTTPATTARRTVAAQAGR